MDDADVAVVGAGIVGIAAAWKLSQLAGVKRVVSIDCRAPMSFTSASSGDNYRNWWPHPVMTALTDCSISQMEALHRDSGGGFEMTRRGYLLATRSDDVDGLIRELQAGYAGSDPASIRFHEGPGSRSYVPASRAGWEAAPSGVDVLSGRASIRKAFPGLDPALRNAIHIRRAGDVDGHRLGSVMLAQARERGLRTMRGRVRGIDLCRGGFRLSVSTAEGPARVRSPLLVNAAGPFVNEIGAMVGYRLPVENVIQQKLAFCDADGAIARDLPFCVDLDGQTIDWGAEERELLRSEEEHAWLAEPMPGGIHCRPEGGAGSRRVKLGWAYNDAPAEPQESPPLDFRFPEIVLRGAARLHPALRALRGVSPGAASHYGGYYTMTRENWPIVGPAGPDGSHAIGAMSGFGTMAACGAASILACLVSGAEAPAFARDLSLARYEDPERTRRLERLARRSVL